MTPPSELPSALRDRDGQLKRKELIFRCPHPENHNNGDANPSARYHLDKGVWYCDVCASGGGWRNLCELLGVPVVNSGKAEIVARYVYLDEDRTELRRKLRWEPGFRGQKKSFSWEKPDGKSGWINCKGDGNPRKLYRSEKLPGVRKRSEVAFVVEGEKDADAGDRLGIAAFCNPEGAAGENQRPKWTKRYSQQLKGLPVVVVADKDKPGRAHAQAIANSLSGEALSVRVLELPGEQVKDLSDWIAWQQQIGMNPEEMRAELKRLATETTESPSNNDQAQPTQAQTLIELASDARLFHAPDDTAFASIPVKGHTETWPVRSGSFRRWLVRRFFRRTNKPPSTQAINDTLSLLEARAQFDGESVPVSTRLAGFGTNIYLDRGAPSWDCLEITADAWRVLEQSPVSFRRAKGMAALCRPVAGGSLENLQEFLNLPDDEAFILVVAWLIAAFRPTGPYPILILLGEQGSAKSTTARVLRSMLDPSTAPVRTMPRDERDLMIAAQNAWILAFDNLSGVPSWLSDAFCRLATGGGFSTRQLYSDDEEKIFDAQRPLLLNGIEELTTRQDLLDRALIVTLPPIPESKRRTEQQLWAEVEAAKPKLLGALLNAVSTGLRRLPKTRLETSPRMADFATWVTAAEPALPWIEGAFLRAYVGNRAEAVDMALESDLVATAIHSLMSGLSEWNGTATDLLKDLGNHASEHTRQSRAWPKSPRVLSGRLRRAATFLRSAAVDVEFYKESGGKSRRMIAIRKRADSCDASDASDALDRESPWNQSLTVASQTTGASQAVASQTTGATQGASQAAAPEALKDGLCVASDASDAKIPGHSMPGVRAVAAGSSSVVQEPDGEREQMDL